MAWRFKASKYKNAAPIVPKPEACVRDITVGSYQTFGNNITASAAFMAFNVDHNGSSLAVLPIDDCGRKSKTMPLLHAHTDTVTDMGFSPFHDGLLATGSQDCLVKIWHIPKDGLSESLTNPECTFSHRQRRVETVLFHPTAENLLTSSSFTTLTLWDILTEKELYSNSEHSEVIQAVGWKLDGSLLATSCKDKQVRVLDPRANCFTHAANSHQSIKDSRVVWLGSSNRILTTGFDANRLRQVFIRDLRNFEETEKALILDSSTGILIPLFDPDTNMLFLAGKGDTTIAYLEVMDREPFLAEGIRHSGEQTKGACLAPKRALKVMEGEVNRVLQLTSNAVIPITYQVPRKSYRDFHADLFPDTAGCKTQQTADQWMEGSNIPIPKISLDPAKRADEAVQVFSVPSVPELNGSKRDNVDAEENQQVEAIRPSEDEGFSIDEPEADKYESPQLDSYGKQEEQEDEGDTAHTPTTADRCKLFERKGEDGEESSPQEGEESKEEKCDEEEEEEGFGSRESLQRRSIAERRKMYESRSVSVQEGAGAAASAGGPSPLPMRRRGGGDANLAVQRQCSLEAPGGRGRRGEKKAPEAAAPTTKRTSTVFGKVSKFRHLKGTPLHKSTHIENIRNISRQISGECDGFHANPDRVAVPLSGPGGKIAVFELSKTGKLPDGVIPTLVHGTNVMDFCWDPFDYSRLAVACDDGMIRLWKIPNGGLLEPTNEAQCTLPGHSEKIYFIKFHPLASDVLASGSYDMTVRIWDLATGTERIVLEGHTDQIFSFAWSPCGTRCATLCKDGRLRIYEPRKSCTPIAEGKGPVGARGARVVWTLEGTHIVTTGFDKVSERQISIFKANDLENPLNTVGLDVSPAILIPFYDDDSSTLFLTGKGDWTIYAFEVTAEAPYLCPLSHHRCPGLHQGLSFLPKSACDIQGVEFAKALRLTNNTIEPLSFTVPRLKVDFFQDDLFPPTKVTWSPTLSSDEWFRGINRLPKRINLKPEGMENLSDAQGGANTAMQPTDQINKAGVGIANVPFNRLGWNADMSGESKEKQEQIQRAVSSRMEMNLKLEQDEMEGVDENEWDE